MSCLLPMFLLLAAADGPAAAYGRGDFKTCAALYEKSLATHRYPAVTAAYNAACCHARAGAKKKAFELLQRAVALGLTDVAKVEGDPDLATLHAEPGWRPLTASIAAAKEAWLSSLSAGLLKLYEEDQADRTANAVREGAARRDAERRKKVDAILAAGGAKAADDYFHAAMVFQHGSTEADIARAVELSKKAVELNPKLGHARWLVAASTDRLLMRQHKPQRYGTQFRREDTGPWVLYDVDPTVTDDERAEWNVPPLAEAKQRAAAMNAMSMPQPAVDAGPARADGGR